MADASVLGADLGDIDTSRREATSGEHSAHFPRVASTQQRREANEGAPTRATGATSGATRGASNDPVKAEIDEAWDGLADEVKAAILAMVRAPQERPNLTSEPIDQPKRSVVYAEHDCHCLELGTQ
jgi:hypothetical protein